MANKDLTLELTLGGSSSSKHSFDLNKTPEPIAIESDSGENSITNLSLCPSLPSVQIESPIIPYSMDDLPMMTKFLCHSDVKQAGRLTLKKHWVDAWFLPSLSEEVNNKIHSTCGALLTVRDLDTNTDHHITVKKWDSVGCIVFISQWYVDFVQRRNLTIGDLIALTWDRNNSIFLFKMLKKRNYL